MVYKKEKNEILQLIGIIFTYNNPNLRITVVAECDNAPRYVHGKSIFFSRKLIHTNNFSMNKTFVASKNQFSRFFK